MHDKKNADRIMMLRLQKKTYPLLHLSGQTLIQQTIENGQK